MIKIDEFVGSTSVTIWDDFAGSNRGTCIYVESVEAPDTLKYM